MSRPASDVFDIGVDGFYDDIRTVMGSDSLKSIRCLIGEEDINVTLSKVKIGDKDAFNIEFNKSGKRYGYRVEEGGGVKKDKIIKTKRHGFGFLKKEQEIYKEDDRRVITQIVHGVEEVRKLQRVRKGAPVLAASKVIFGGAAGGVEDITDLNTLLFRLQESKLTERYYTYQDYLREYERSGDEGFISASTIHKNDIDKLISQFAARITDDVAKIIPRYIADKKDTTTAIDEIDKLELLEEIAQEYRLKRIVKSAGGLNEIFFRYKNLQELASDEESRKKLAHQGITLKTCINKVVDMIQSDKDGKKFKELIDRIKSDPGGQEYRYIVYGHSIEICEMIYHAYLQREARKVASEPILPVLVSEPVSISISGGAGGKYLNDIGSIVREIRENSLVESLEAIRGISPEVIKDDEDSKKAIQSRKDYIEDRIRYIADQIGSVREEEIKSFFDAETNQDLKVIFAGILSCYSGYKATSYLNLGGMTPDFIFRQDPIRARGLNPQEGDSILSACHQGRVRSQIIYNVCEQNGLNVVGVVGVGLEHLLSCPSVIGCISDPIKPGILGSMEDEYQNTTDAVSRLILMLCTFKNCKIADDANTILRGREYENLGIPFMVLGQTAEEHLSFGLGAQAPFERTSRSGENLNFSQVSEVRDAFRSIKRSINNHNRNNVDGAGKFRIICAQKDQAESMEKVCLMLQNPRAFIEARYPGEENRLKREAIIESIPADLLENTDMRKVQLEFIDERFPDNVKTLIDLKNPSQAQIDRGKAALLGLADEIRGILRIERKVEVVPPSSTIAANSGRVRSVFPSAMVQ